MIERFKELAFEAGQGGHSWYNDPNCIQAFAELIVAECASIAGKAEYNDTWNEPVEDTIKKHFGVKE